MTVLLISSINLPYRILTQPYFRSLGKKVFLLRLTGILFLFLAIADILLLSSLLLSPYFLPIDIDNNFLKAFIIIVAVFIFISDIYFHIKESIYFDMLMLNNIAHNAGDKQTKSLDSHNEGEQE